MFLCSSADMVQLTTAPDVALSLRHVECRLEMIIAETSNKEGPHLDVSEQNPEGVYFTSYK